MMIRIIALTLALGTIAPASAMRVAQRAIATRITPVTLSQRNYMDSEEIETLASLIHTRKFTSRVKASKHSTDDLKKLYRLCNEKVMALAEPSNRTSNMEDVKEDFKEETLRFGGVTGSGVIAITPLIVSFSLDLETTFPYCFAIIPGFTGAIMIAIGSLGTSVYGPMALGASLAHKIYKTHDNLVFKNASENLQKLQAQLETQNSQNKQ